jgi:hypothetical protein
MTHLLIATPTAGGVVKALYATTLIKVVKAIKEAGWDLDFVTVDGSYISRARNYFAHVLLSQSNLSHLVMIDSDMAVEGHVIPRLIATDKPFVAAAYSQRRMDMSSFARASRNAGLALSELTALALEYNLQPELEEETRKIKVVDGMCRVNYVALGCSIIRRDAFELLIRADVVRPRPDRFLERSGFQGPFFDFFCEITLDDGDILSEDYSFCRRWRSVAGNEIWALIDESIGHVGEMVYGAPYVNRLRQGKA